MDKVRKNFTDEELSVIKKNRIKLGASEEDVKNLINKLQNMNTIKETEEPDQRQLDHAS